MKPDARQRVIQEAARILLEQGAAGDYAAAIRKAAHRLGVREKRQLPSQAEVHDALMAERRLFSPDPDPTLVNGLVHLCLDIMSAFAAFEPRLVGPDLADRAELDTPLSFFIFTDTPEDIAMTLIDRRLRWRAGERRLRFADGRHQGFPLYTFELDETLVELVALPRGALSNPPINELTERAERGLSRTQLIASQS